MLFCKKFTIVRNMRTEEIFYRVKKYITKQQMIVPGDTVLVGVSGGADSVCLLSVLWELSKQIDFRLLVMHVHHGVREEADEDAAYVEALCREMSVPFYYKKVDMYAYAKEKGISPEEAGRQLRYQAFAEVLPETSYKIAVAHNKNDRAETMLFHLCRGSGLTGLCGIRPIRGNIIRPLLCLERTEIEAYLKEKEIAFCIDHTNEEDTYTRNKIRHHMLPYAEAEICQNVVAHMGDTADILMQAEDYIQKQTKLAFVRCCMEQAPQHFIMDTLLFQKEDLYIQQRILLSVMEELTPHRKDITKEHIEALLSLIGKEGSKQLSLPYDLCAYKEYNKLHMCLEKEFQSTLDVTTDNWQIQIPVTIPGEVEVPGLGVMEFTFLSEEDFFYKKGQIIPEKTYTKWFDYDKITRTLVVRTRKTGDYLTIDKEMKRKSVKDYMINEKIPKTKRNQLFLLAEDEHILWVPGFRISQYYKVSKDTKRILQVRIRGGR